LIFWTCLNAKDHMVSWQTTMEAKHHSLKDTPNKRYSQNPPHRRYLRNNKFPTTVEPRWTTPAIVNNNKETLFVKA
jgi:hypothetical protein